MKNVLGFTLLATALLSPSVAALTQKFHSDMRDMHLRGSETIRLKRMMKRQLSPQMLRGYKLDSVTIEAKSKHGKADVSLEIGFNETYPKTIAGTPEQFESGMNYNTITLNAPRSSSRAGRDNWQLHFQGNVKLDKVSGTLKRQVGYDYSEVSRLSFQSKKTFKASKVIGDTKTISTHGLVKAIQLKGHKESVRVTQVVINYQDGQKVIVDELHGKLKKGRTTAFKLKRDLRKPIRSIKVSAHSTKLFGSRGKLEVLLAQ